MASGWHISVYRQQTDGAEPAALGALRGTQLAVWQASHGGLSWLDKLVDSRKAVLLGGIGYPTEYTARAEDIIPVILGEPPHARAVWAYDVGDTLLPGWSGRTTRDLAAIDECRANEWLLIEAWDES